MKMLINKNMIKVIGLVVAVSGGLNAMEQDDQQRVVQEKQSLFRTFKGFFVNEERAKELEALEIKKTAEVNEAATEFGDLSTEEIEAQCKELKKIEAQKSKKYQQAANKEWNSYKSTAKDRCAAVLFGCLSASCMSYGVREVAAILGLVALYKSGLLGYTMRKAKNAIFGVSPVAPASQSVVSKAETLKHELKTVQLKIQMSEKIIKRKEWTSFYQNSLLAAGLAGCGLVATGAGMMLPGAALMAAAFYMAPKKWCTK